MKKIILNMFILASICTTAFAELRPFIGIPLNSFGISSTGITLTDPSSGFSFTVDEETSDRGFGVGVNFGLILDQNGRITVSYFSGTETDSNLFTATIASAYYDYSFNKKGGSNGYFLGIGFSNVKLEIESSILTTYGTENGTGLLIRGGVERFVNDDLFIQIGFNAHTAEIQLKSDGVGTLNGALVETNEMGFADWYISASYLF
jgi:hypothetical protein